MNNKQYNRRGGDAVIDDPYLKQINYREPNICPGCGAVYNKKRWQFDSELKREVMLENDYNQKKCPACRKKEDKYPMGLVFISGSFLDNHKDSILNTIKGEEKRAMDKNPLERIIEIEKKDKNDYLIKTTTDTLAHRIGNILHKSFKGDLNYKFSDNQKILRVLWSRD